MSEFTITRDNRTSFRRKLLAGASALALTGYAASATAEDAGRPVLWLEFGAVLDHVSGPSEPLVPPFAQTAVQYGLISVEGAQTAPRYSFGGDLAVSFQPADSDWFLAASIRFGRSNGKKHDHQQIEVPPIYVSSAIPSLRPQGPNHNTPLSQTADYAVRSTERHLLLDFQAGKDVGLGMLSRDSESRLALGVRIAQFTAKSNLSLFADPNPHLASKYLPPFQRSAPVVIYYQFYKAKPQIERNFHGLGPALSWTASVPLAGSDGDQGVLAFDWGINASLLFGRQKTRIAHHTTGDTYKHNAIAKYYVHNHYINTTVTQRSRSVTVPNIGGVAGLSLKFPNAKISLGYRVDFFFGAVDGGIDTAKKENRGFFGPFASISIGIGD